MTKEQLKNTGDLLNEVSDMVESIETSLRYLIDALRNDCKIYCGLLEMDAAIDTLEKTGDMPITEQIEKLETIARYLIKTTDELITRENRVLLDVRLHDVLVKATLYNIVTSLDWLSYAKGAEW